MTKILFFAIQLLLLNFAVADIQTCSAEVSALKALCDTQELTDEGAAFFSNCSSGFSYYFSNEAKEDHFTMESKSSCKIKELRHEKSLDSKTTFISQTSEKTVVYQHTNGLSNTFVYGATGYYHISETESGDSLYDFHMYTN